MTRSCPLPVDWLDFLDGVGELELADHLSGCSSCQVLVNSLRHDTPATVPADWAATFMGRTEAVWHEDRPTNPAPAEFWFSAADFRAGRVVGWTREAQRCFELCVSRGRPGAGADHQPPRPRSPRMARCCAGSFRYRGRDRNRPPARCRRELARRSLAGAVRASAQGRSRATGYTRGLALRDRRKHVVRRARRRGRRRPVGCAAPAPR